MHRRTVWRRRSCRRKIHNETRTLDVNLWSANRQVQLFAVTEESLPPEVRGVVRVRVCDVLHRAVIVYFVQCHTLLLGCVHVRFDNPTDPGVVTSGLCRGELEGVVAGAGRVMAAVSALQTRCATEIEALDDGGVNSKTVLREAGRMSTRAANTVAKTAAGLAEMPKLAESLAGGAITVEHATVAVGAAAKTSAEQVRR